jgi:hypothetical protein
MAVSLKAKWQRREIASPTGKGLRYLQPLKSTLGAVRLGDDFSRKASLSLPPSPVYSWLIIHGFLFMVFALEMSQIFPNSFCPGKLRKNHVCTEVQAPRIPMSAGEKEKQHSAGMGVWFR